MPRKKPKPKYIYVPPPLPSAIDMAVKRYAVLEDSGTPRRCNASIKERTGQAERKGALKPKVVYATRELAEAARIDIERAAPNRRRLYVYECKRVKIPHYHIATSFTDCV